MAFNPEDFRANTAYASGFVAQTSATAGIEDLEDPSLPIFRVEHVQLQFPIASDFVAAQVANNVIVLALASGRLLRIDLYNPADIDDIDLPRKASEIGSIRKLFLDPTASHLLISTTQGENFYLHQSSHKVKPLAKLKGIYIESVAWNPALPSASTREILIGSQSGAVYEIFIEPTEESYKRDERYMKQVYRMTEAQPISGLFVELVPGLPDMRRVVLTTPTKMLHFMGRIARHGASDATSIFSRYFEAELPNFQENVGSTYSMLSISPESEDDVDPERIYAWSHGAGLSFGKLFSAPVTTELGDLVFRESKILPITALPQGGREITSVALTHYHILIMCKGVLYAINRFDESIVFQDFIGTDDSRILGIRADPKCNTFWVFTNDTIFEVVLKDEQRDVWKIMLKQNLFDSAMRFASNTRQKDQVSIASGDYLAAQKKYLEAAGIWGKSTKPFEEVCLVFLENGEHTALRKYLLTKLSSLPKTSVMQRMIVSTWLVEVFMSALNALDDRLSAKTETSGEQVHNTATQLDTVRDEYYDFVNRYKNELDKKTTYEVISSHGRETELLYFASAIKDWNYVLNYWVQRENWREALTVLKKQTEPDIFYKYASVLMSNAPVETVDILTRQANLDPVKLIPALLNYNEKADSVPISENQATKYLGHAIDRLGSTEPAIHNTLLSLLAASKSKDESQLLTFLRKHEANPHYSADFALRICIKHERVQSAVHIYTMMEKYQEAVNLALRHGDTELASIIANRTEDDPALMKTLWLSIAKTVIKQSGGAIKPALEVLNECKLLKIEDLIPFFPDFVVIDDFKEQICAALEEYSYKIDRLKKEMDDSAKTADNIRHDIELLDRRYAIIEPGERCYVCQDPLLAKQFFVFPCQHAFHTDCLAGTVKTGGAGVKTKIEGLEKAIEAAGPGTRREKLVEEFDSLVAAACVLCSDFAIRLISEPFVTAGDNRGEWAV
ncbi:Vacuolar membrane protein [Drechslerella dactyloides]|uniref:Vacuolar membrane protein n=1 Tax=Drechslerella dactyloides TaxID=74499 RepID=A0AAD6NNV0_DREDA|nr:Vacuolar membrane protein [Drechslerella dactyloides]